MNNNQIEITSDTNKKKSRDYTEVFNAKYSEKEKALGKQGFEENYGNLKKLYKYCRSKRNDKYLKDKGYDSIIVDLINGKDKRSEDEIELMNKINYISLWKTNRIIEFQDPKEVKELLDDFKKDGKISKAKKLLKELLNPENKGIDLAMASTILHFYKPDKYPIIDRRAHRALYQNSDKLPVKIDHDNQESSDDEIKIYFDYVERCNELVEKINNDIEHKGGGEISMENIDQFLYQIDKMTGEKLGEYKIQRVNIQKEE